MDTEQWSLGTATADVDRGDGRVTVTVRGVVTAMAYEALHLHLAREKAAHRSIVIDDLALMAVTSCSAAEAAVRGTPVRHAGLPILLGVGAWRMDWALKHCRFMTEHGLCRVAFCRSPEPMAQGTVCRSALSTFQHRRLLG
jgi:hypothetical protein